MSENQHPLEKKGITVSSLGGLLVILNLTVFKEHKFVLILSIIAVVTTLVGVIMIQKGKQKRTDGE